MGRHCGQDRRREKEKRSDEKTRSEKDEERKGSFVQTGKMAYTKAVEVWNGLQGYHLALCPRCVKDPGYTETLRERSKRARMAALFHPQGLLVQAGCIHLLPSIRS